MANHGFAAALVTVSFALLSWAQDPDPQIAFFTNVNVFDGVNEELIEDANVVVTGNKITAVSTEPLAVAGGRVIDGGGRTMIPGRLEPEVNERRPPPVSDSSHGT